MTDSANDHANLAYELDEPALTADPNCPSLAQVLWESLANMPTPQDTARFTGFNGIELPEQQ